MLGVPGAAAAGSTGAAGSATTSTADGRRAFAAAPDVDAQNPSEQVFKTTYCDTYTNRAARRSLSGSPVTP